MKVRITAVLLLAIGTQPTDIRWPVTSRPKIKNMTGPRYLLSLLIVFLLTQHSFGQSPVLHKFIGSYVKAHNFHGTVLIRKNSKLMYVKSFGLANRQLKVPNKIDTKYKLASITKAFTSVLILQLFERGEIDLNKTIKTYLPNYTGEGADRVTVHQLLNHTSGIENIDKGVTMESALQSGIPHYQTPQTTDQLLAKYCSGHLVNEPGQVFDYNNADYMILGKIIERVHGKPYEQVLRENILQPLKMADSGMLYQHTVLDKLADTYFFRDDLRRVVNDLPVYIENWYAAGAMYSTVNDVLKFSNALFGSKLLRPETLALMIKPGLDDYGYGVWSYEIKVNNKKHRVVKRPGQIMGAQSMLFHVLDEDVTIIILSNTGTASLDEFAAEIGKRIIK